MKVFVFTCIFVFISLTAHAIKVGDIAPNFNLMDVEGEKFDLQANRGNIIVLFFMGYS